MASTWPLPIPVDVAGNYALDNDEPEAGILKFNACMKALEDAEEFAHIILIETGTVNPKLIS